MLRRDFIRSAVVAMVAGTGATRVGAAELRKPKIAVMAELQFDPVDEEAAADALGALAEATRAEPGCERYVVGRDLTKRGLFHLSELWTNLDSLAAHFGTTHMSDFSAKARALGYSAGFMKRLELSEVDDLDVRALRRR